MSERKENGGVVTDTTFIGGRGGDRDKFKS